VSQVTRAINKDYQQGGQPLFQPSQLSRQASVIISTYTMLRHHPLDSLVLQSNHQSLYGCGDNHIRTGESMSLPSQ
jgi:hypothetical protein